MSTTFETVNTVKHDWYQVDAKDQILGRLALRISKVLMGKNKPIYSPNVDCGDYIVVTGVEGIRVTGKKATDKIYHFHSGFVGGMKDVSFEKLLERKPEKVLKLAVKNMLPKNQIGRDMLKKLKVYVGTEHPHAAQLPKDLPE